MSDAPRLSVVVPCFNEQGNLRALVEEACALLPGLAGTFELLPVDDGSSDGTFALAERLAAERPGLVRPLRHERNRGMGAGVRTGVAAARGEWVLVVPGDNQFDLAQVGAMLARAADAGADVVVGERASAYQEKVKRSLPSWLYTVGVRVLFGLRLRGEVNLYRRAALAGVAARADGFFGNTELLIRVLRRGARAVSFPVRFRPRAAGVATGRDPRRVAQLFFEVARSWAWMWWERLVG